MSINFSEKFKIATQNSFGTRTLGKNLAKRIMNSEKQRQKAMVLALIGDLGAGKTTFLQGFAKGLGVKEKILSPTFVITKRFRLSNCPIRQFCNFYHIDCYRLQKAEEVLDLGFKEIINNPKNILAIEWADKIKKILPKETTWIKFKFIGKNKRQIMLK